MKKLILVALVAVFTVLLIAQINFSPQLLFHKEINFGGDRDNVLAAISDETGFFVSGFKLFKDGEVWKDFSRVFKYDQNSNLVWEYTGVENAHAWWQSLAIAPDGIFLGEGWDTASITKLDNQGNLVWKKNLGTEASPILASNENSLVVVLSTSSISEVIVYDLEANEINSWSVDLDKCYATILDENNLYILGNNPGGVQTNGHSEIIKTDLQGNIAWTDTLMDVFGLRGAIDNNDNLYVSGYYLNDVQSYYRIVKYDLDGNRIWERYYDGDFQASYNLSNRVNSVIAHPNGGCVVVKSGKDRQGRPEYA